MSRVHKHACTLVGSTQQLAQCPERIFGFPPCNRLRKHILADGECCQVNIVSCEHKYMQSQTRKAGMSNISQLVHAIILGRQNLNSQNNTGPIQRSSWTTFREHLVPPILFTFYHLCHLVADPGNCTASVSERQKRKKCGKNCY